MGKSDTSSGHQSNINDLAADINTYTAYQTGTEVYSDNLVVVFSETPDFFKTVGSSASEAGGNDILGEFESKDTDFLFLRPNTKYDFYRSSGKKEAGATYNACTGTSNDLAVFINAESTASSYTKINYVGFGLAGSFAALWYSLNVSTKPDNCVISHNLHKVPAGWVDSPSHDAAIKNINNLPGYSASYATYYTTSQTDLADNSSTQYYLPGSSTAYAARGSYSADAGEDAVAEASKTDMTGWGSGASNITIRSNMAGSWFTDMFTGIGARSA